MGKNEELISNLPIWNGPVTWVPLSGGLSNESYTVTDEGRKFVVRFGRDFPFHHVCRNREVMTTRAAHAAGFAPELVYAAPGVMVSHFIVGKTFDASDVRANIPRIAALVRDFHVSMQSHVSGAGFAFWVFHVIRDYAKTLDAGNSRMRAELPRYLRLAQELETAQIAMPIVFGHHDLLPANFIDDGKKIWLIDFEYAGFGTPAFDLAGIASNAEFTELQSDELLCAYLDHEPNRELKRAHAAMQCASLLREAMWSMVSELNLAAPGVDYEAYTAENLVSFERSLVEYRTRHN